VFRENDAPNLASVTGYGLTPHAIP